MKKEKGINGVFSRRFRSLPWPLLMIFLFLTFTIAVSGYFYYQKLKKDEIVEQTTQLQAIADLKAAEIQRWLKERLGDARLIMENPFLKRELLGYLRDRAPGRRLESIRKWMASLRDNYHYQNVMLLDVSREVLLTLDTRYPTVGAEKMDVLEAARQGKNVVFSGLRLSAEVPFPHLDIFLPLLAEDTAAGFVLLRIDPADYLFPMIQSWPTSSPSAETLLAERQGDAVLFLNELRHRRGTAMKLRLPVRSPVLPAARAVLGKVGPFQGMDYRGMAVWSVNRPIPGTSWFIVAKVDKDEIERPTRQSALAIILFVLIMILTASLAIFFFWQRQNARFRLRQIESESQKQALVEHFDYVTRYANDIILHSDDQGNILEANDRALTTYGYGREALLEMNLRELCPPEERDKLTAAYRKTGDKSGSIFETVHLKKDGSVFPVEVSARAIAVGDKKYFQSIIRDISERKQAEENIRKEQDLYMDLVNTIPSGMYRLRVKPAENWDEKNWRSQMGSLYSVDFVSDRFCEITGISREEFAANPGIVPDRVHPDEKPGFVQRNSDAVNSLSTFNWEGRMIVPQKGTIWVRFESIPRKLENGEVLWTGIVNDINERKQAEETIRKSEARLRAILDATPFPVAIVDVQDEKIDFWSRSALALFGHTAPTTAEWYELAYPDPGYRHDVVERWKPLMEKARASGKPVNTGEYRVTCRDGSVRVCELYATMLEENLIVTFNDITERKRAEEALRVSEDKFRYVFDNSLLGKSITLPSGEINVNKAFCDLLGYSAEELKSRNWKELTHPDDVESTQKMIDKLLSGKGDSARFEKRYIHKNGSLIWADVSTTLRRDAGGRPLYFMTSVLDITERKLAEAEIRHLNEELEERVRQRTAELSDLYNNAPCGYHSLDSEGTFMQVNDTELKWLGYNRGEIIGKSKFADLLTPESIATFQRNFPLFKEQGWIDNLEFDMKRKNGLILPVLLSATAIKDASGHYLMSRSTIIDNSEQKRAQRIMTESQTKLLAANKELEAFSYSVSHDLRAPLRAIDGFSRIILEDYAPRLDDEGRRLFDVIRDNTRKMGHLIDDLLAFSRLSRQQMAVAPVDLAALAVAIFAELKNAEAGRKIELKVTAMPAAYGDRSMLRQVLQNLLANAVKFTRNKPRARIEFGGRAAIGEAIYFVKDNGAGFNMEYVDKLFGVFQRLHGSDEFEGTGVGLAIVQRIVLRHRGRVWAESGKNGGATFYFALPGAGASATGVGVENPEGNEEEA